MPEKIDSGIAQELVDSVKELQNTNNERWEELEKRNAEATEKNQELEDRLDITETENEDLKEQVKTLDKPVRKVAPAASGGFLPGQGLKLNWDIETKENFAKDVLIPMYQGKTIILKTTGAQQEETTTEGGHLVFDEYLPEIQRIIGEQSLALKLARIIPMKKLYMKIPYAGSTAASVAWTAEETAATESKVDFGQHSLMADRLDAFSTVSNELLEDADVDVVDYLVELFTEAMGEEIDNQVFAGTGSPVSGITVGVNACGYSVTFDSGSQSWSQLKADYLSKMISKVSSSVLAGCVWVGNQTALHYVRILKDDQSRPIYQFPYQGAVGSVYGFPFYTSAKMPSTETGASKPMLIFGNFKRGYIIGRRKELEVESTRALKIKENQSVIVYRQRLALLPNLVNCFVRLITAAS